MIVFFIISKIWMILFFFFSSRRRHTRSDRDWSSDVCSSDLWTGRRQRHFAEIGREAHKVRALGQGSSGVLVVLMHFRAESAAPWFGDIIEPEDLDIRILCRDEGRGTPLQETGFRAGFVLQESQ